MALLARAPPPADTAGPAPRASCYKYPASSASGYTTQATAIPVAAFLDSLSLVVEAPAVNLEAVIGEEDDYHH